MFNQKELAKHRQTAQIQNFKLGQDNSLQVAVISRIPGILYANKTITYSKDEMTVPNAGFIHFIKKEDEPDGFVWHAPEEALEHAVRYGLIPVEAPTAKAIAALGIYKQQILTRAYEKGIISNKHKQKDALVTMAQNTMTALQGLERLANTFNKNVDLDAEKNRINTVITETIDSLHQLKIKAKTDLDSLNTYDKGAVKKIERFYEDDITSLHHLQSRVAASDAGQIKGMLRTTGMDSIPIKVKTRCIATLVKIQELNQNMTYSRRAQSLMRGDLNSAIEDALKVLRDYEADPHNPILLEHQGHYTPNANTDTIELDFTHLAHNEKKAKITLRAIIQISSDGIQPTTSTARYTLNGQPLKTTHFTKWTTNAKSGFLFIITRIGAGIINVATGTIVGLAFDLPIGFLTSFLSIGRYKMPSQASKIAIHVDTGAPTQTKAAVLIEKLAFKPYSAGVLIGQKLGSLVGETVLDITLGIWQSAKNFRFKGFDEFISDFKTGAWENGDSQDYKLRVATSTLKTLRYTKAAFERRIAETENTVPSKHPQAQQHTESVLHFSTKIALPPYHLNSGEYDDISNAGIDGLIAVFETFIHNIHVKHPFTGLIFSGTYALGALTILAPGIMGFLNKYIEFSQLIGKLMAQGTNSAAIASGFTQAKVLAATFEGIIHGGDSWISIGAKEFEKNPANTLVYSAIAVGIGYGLANYAEIPGLSEYIQDDAGDIPEVGWAFAGAKIGLLLIEVLEPKEDADTSDRDSLIAELNQELSKALPKVTHDELVDLRNKLLDHTEQFARQLNEQYQHEIKRLKFLHVLQENQAVLSKLDNKTKRDLLFIAHDRFKGLDDQSARLRSLKKALYPQLRKSIFTRTMTLIADYIPLVVRCGLSPVSASLQPWRDLSEKVIKDTTRIAHGLSKLINYTIKTFIRLAIRGLADVLGNEIPARLEGLLCNDHHSISRTTYGVTNCYEKSAETMRQLASTLTGVDALRSAATSPALETVFCQSQQQTLSKLSSYGFFRNYHIYCAQYRKEYGTTSRTVSSSNSCER